MSARRIIPRRERRRAALTVLALATLLAAALLVLYGWESRQTAAVDPGYTPGLNLTRPLQEVTWQGRTYRQRQGVTTWLFIGVDQSGEALGTDSYIGGGQGDVQLVLAVDDDAQTWQLLQLDRDTMADIPVLGVRGDVVGTVHEQLCMAHSYGNGRQQSCENNVNTVSVLLNGQSIDGYLALNMDAVSVLTELVGGVTVTVTSDFSAVDPSLEQGCQLTLNGEQALTFVRARRGVDDETNAARMARQRAYLSALRSCGALRQEDFAVRAGEALSPYMVSNIPSGTAQKLLDKLNTYRRLEPCTLSGESRVEEGHWAFYPDEDSLWQTILTLFYEPV